MEALQYSFIIPVYNRPNEIDELLMSLMKMKTSIPFEVVIVEDGSVQTAKAVVKRYAKILDISYFEKPNSGPGDSRNFGMQKAKGNYFIILDSDCLIPQQYLEVVHKTLIANFADCYGGPDAAHDSFTELQKAINFAMTSALSTGGIRGRKSAAKKFQARSFNMGLSKVAFQATKGFGKIHPGEDPDLSIRLQDLGFSIKLIPEAFVYHKRRLSWRKFYTQVYKFGSARAILNTWHPQTARFIYWMPTLFLLGLFTSLAALLIGLWFPIGLYAIFFVTLFISALLQTKKIVVASLAVIAVCIQFFAYGYGFLISTFKLYFSTHKDARKVLPNLFFK